MIQERVGASASRACVNIVRLCMTHPELKGYPGVCLYDSIVIFAPFNERFLWAKILQLYMRAADGWICPGNRILRLGVDTESIWFHVSASYREKESELLGHPNVKTRAISSQACAGSL